MTKTLPLSLWLDILVRLDGCDLKKVFKCGLLGNEWEDDSLWAALCKKRLALHGPDAVFVKDIYGQSVRYRTELLSVKVDCDSDVVSHRDWYLNAIRTRGTGQRVDFQSVLRGVYKIYATPLDEETNPILKMTIIQNGIRQKFLILRSGKSRISCNEYIHMTQTGPLLVLCHEPVTLELERKEDVALSTKYKLKSGRIDQPDGKILVAACSCWGAWIDHRHMWCPVYSEKSPFGQVMFMQHCTWVDIYCLFKRMRSDVRYQCSWKVDVQSQAHVFCGVKIFRHDPLRPVPIMAPVGFKPDLSEHNEWDAWRDWYAVGKDETTSEFLRLRREHSGPEYCESPIQTLAFHRWDKDGVLGILDTSSCGEHLVDIQLSFTAPPNAFYSGCIVDHFALIPVK